MKQILKVNRIIDGGEYTLPVNAIQVGVHVKYELIKTDEGYDITMVAYNEENEKKRHWGYVAYVVYVESVKE